MSTIVVRILAASLVALVPAYAAQADEAPTDSTDKSVGQTAREFGQAVGRDAKAVGQAVKEGAKEVAAATQRGAKRVKTAVVQKEATPKKPASKEAPAAK